MFEYLPAIAVPGLILVALVFLVFRLRFFTLRDVSGRAPFVIGSVLILLAAAGQAVKAAPQYAEWFVAAAYPWIDMVQLLLFVSGLLLLVAGLSLYADFWQNRGEEVDTRDRKLSVLTNLQRDAREPYQLLELLNLSIKEILGELTECAGAIFLVNRSRRQLVLTASLALTRQETASLEYYPFERNAISQSVDLGEPMICGNFDLYDSSGAAQPSRFRSSLVLPLVSGMEKIGAIVLFAEQPQFFSRTEVRYLSPVAEWLAEKIKSTRLAREVAFTKSEVERHVNRYSDLSTRLLATSDAFFAGGDAQTAFCRSLVGFFSCESVHLIGLADGTLSFYAGSQPLPNMTENYKTALIDALDRDKPLIINQEAVDENGRSFIAQSTLLFPVKGKGRQDAMLFRKDSGPFKVTESNLETIEIFARLAAMIIRQSDTTRLDITRRKGFARILQLLRFHGDGPPDASTAFLMEHLADILPAGSAAIAFGKQVNGSFKAIESTRSIDKRDMDAFDMLPGEGFVGQAAGSREPQFAFGPTAVDRAMEMLQMTNREAFRRVFGERGLPALLVACPILCRDRVIGVVAMSAYDVNESRKGEWERLLTLAVELFSVRLTIAELHEKQTPAPPARVDDDVAGHIANRLNNHLSAVIGNAELAVSRPDLSGELKSHFDGIIAEAQLAAECVRNALGHTPPGDLVAPVEPSGGAEDTNAILDAFLDQARIANDLYMVGERPVEINRRFHPVARVTLSESTVRSLVREVINHFAALALEDEVLTVSTYRLEGSVYLDISRHHKDLPSVERIAAFGTYQSPEEIIRQRPGATFLDPVVGMPCFCSLDCSSHSAVYLSLRFPVSEEALSVDRDKRRGIRILAVDDQTVILELITAMCQSMGHEIRTASSGQDALKLAERMGFDLVLTDLAMPGMSGLDFAARLKRIHPDVPIILVTGWEIAIQPKQLEEAGVIGILRKPFRIEQLTDLINSAASGRRVH